MKSLIAIVVAGLVPLLCSPPAYARFGGGFFFPFFFPSPFPSPAPRCPFVRPEPDALRAVPPLASAGDTNVSVSLEAIIVRDGPGSWARKAFFDEYRFRMSGSGRLLRVRLLDALGNPVESSTDPPELVRESCRVEERYRSHGIDTPRGGPACARLPRWLPEPPVSRTCGAELKGYQSPLPVTLGTTAELVSAFFPVVPWPSGIELVYTDGDTERSILLADRVLGHVHRLVNHRPEPALPAEAVRRGLEMGQVMAVLSINTDGEVVDVKVTAASSPVFVEEARDMFLKYRYMPAWQERTVEEVMHFGRGPVTQPVR